MSKQTKFRGQLNRQYRKNQKIRWKNFQRISDTNTRRDTDLMAGLWDGADQYAQQS